MISKPVRIATIIKPKKNCPRITDLPGASPALIKHVRDILTACRGVHIQKSKKLNRRQFNSINLLEMEPPLFLVDGSDQSLNLAAAAVDAFVAAHAVLEISWEPIYVSDPLWWVLIPRPKGMPGNLIKYSLF
jgi:hypothetical protein